jgi:hypothetical protein
MNGLAAACPPNWRRWPLGTGPGQVEVRGQILEVDSTGGTVCPRCLTREPVWLVGEHCEGVRAYGSRMVRPDGPEDQWRQASAPAPAPAGPASGPVFSRARSYRW